MIEMITVGFYLFLFLLIFSLGFILDFPSKKTKIHLSVVWIIFIVAYFLLLIVAN